jgi:hypothetical protein
MRMAVICLLAFVPCALSYEHGQVDGLPQTCKNRLNQLYSTYYSTEVLDSTVNCKQMIQTNLADAQGQNCSVPEDLRACFNVSGVFPLSKLHIRCTLTSIFA